MSSQNFDRQQSKAIRKRECRTQNYMWSAKNTFFMPTYKCTSDIFSYLRKPFASFLHHLFQFFLSNYSWASYMAEIFWRRNPTVILHSQDQNRPQLCSSKTHSLFLGIFWTFFFCAIGYGSISPVFVISPNFPVISLFSYLARFGGGGCFGPQPKLKVLNWWMLQAQVK